MAERGAVKMASRAEPEGGDSTQIKLPCTLRSKVTQSGGGQFSATRGKRDITLVTDSVTNLDPFVNYWFLHAVVSNNIQHWTI